MCRASRLARNLRWTVVSTLEATAMLECSASPIPLLTTEELEGISSAANGPGRLAKSWPQLTRIVRDRLAPGAGRKPRVRKRLYRDGANYVAFSLVSATDFVIELGRLNENSEPLRLGHLQAHWDELGVTGPYRITLRGREHTLGTFVAVLEHYLTLPEMA